MAQEGERARRKEGVFEWLSMLGNKEEEETSGRVGETRRFCSLTAFWQRVENREDAKGSLKGEERKTRR